ncbi:sugar transferase [Clostridium hydrogenum]|uniref:sugar transferase n=1 Tax=Clostridium hydrogenum TaxID=2855764 RepID=UPI002E30B40A|nr:exopolysaccharide biosynthesis polyprenyl glycosylphosphotransferase [Clostridium hydrogenum]
MNYEAINYYERGYGYNFVKRFIDVVCSLVGIVILSPVMLIVAIAIKINSKGPIIFAQERIGKNGQRFKMYKFRSMVVNAEDLLYKLKGENEMSGPMFKMKEDPRVTSVGKFIRKTSIDELPQLFNVLKGEMSLVGPRPNLPSEVAGFTDWQKQKFLVRPGLTCYWQVMGRNDIGFEEWMRLDIKYIKERSTLLDLKLIFKTFFVLFGDEHAR